MIFLINVIALYASFSSNNIYSVFWGAILPALYAIVMAPHALLGRTDMPPATISKVLAEKWENADDLTAYIVKYWMALASPTTSWKKQLNTVILCVTAFFLGFVYFLRELFAGGIVLFVVAYVLYKMSLRIDRPRSVYTNADFRDGSDNEFARKEWEVAAMAIVAFSDLFPTDRALKKSADEVSEDGDVKLLLAKYRHEHGLGWVA